MFTIRMSYHQMQDVVYDLEEADKVLNWHDSLVKCAFSLLNCMTWFLVYMHVGVRVGVGLLFVFILPHSVWWHTAVCVIRKHVPYLLSKNQWLIFFYCPALSKLFKIVPGELQTHSVRQHIVGPTASPPSSYKGGIRSSPQIDGYLVMEHLVNHDHGRLQVPWRVSTTWGSLGRAVCNVR